MHPPHNLLHLFPQIHSCTIVQRGIIHKQPLWPDLRQPIQHPLGPHIRTTTAKQPSERRDSQEDRERIHTVTRYNRHTIPLDNSLHTHSRRQPPHLPPQLSPRVVADLDAALADFGRRDFGVFLAGCAARGGGGGGGAGEEDVFGKVEADAAEPVGDVVHADVGLDDLFPGGGG